MKKVGGMRHLGSDGNWRGCPRAKPARAEGVDDEKAAEYISSEGFVPIEDAKQSLSFSKPANPDGKPNLFKPYVYTYYFGRKDYVLPTFQKAQKKDKLKEFFRILYLNPYSRLSATWKTAFLKI